MFEKVSRSSVEHIALQIKVDVLIGEVLILSLRLTQQQAHALLCRYFLFQFHSHGNMHFYAEFVTVSGKNKQTKKKQSVGEKLIPVGVQLPPSQFEAIQCSNTWLLVILAQTAISKCT